MGRKHRINDGSLSPAGKFLGILTLIALIIAIVLAVKG
jgi:hypothetical protein